jgi:hypothetical protein
MLKGLTILTLFATVGLSSAQTAPLSPPKEGIAKTSSSQSGSAQTHSQDSGEHAGDAMAASAKPPTPTCDGACQQSRENLAIQRKLEWFTGVLAVVGVLQVCTMFWQGWLLHGTMKTIEVQAVHMERQTAAANLSAQAAMGVAVPTLMLDEFSFMPSATQSLKDDLRWPRMRISVKNFGQSPAFLRSFAVEFTCNEHPSAMKYPHVLYFDPGTAVEAGKSFPLEEAGVASWEGFSEEDAAAIAAGKKTLFVYGCIWYGDVFGPAVHELRFCKWATEFGKANGGLWIECDNPYERQDQNPN